MQPVVYILVLTFVLVGVGLILTVVNDILEFLM